MKRAIVLVLILYKLGFINAQDCCTEVAKQALKIDSLQKTILAKENYYTNTIEDLQNKLKIEIESKQKLNSEYLKLKKFKEEKKDFEIQFKNQEDSIKKLKHEILQKEEQLSSEDAKCEQRIYDEVIHTKNKLLADILNIYKKPFDDLIKLSTKSSVQRDLEIVDKNQEIKSVLLDLEKFFEAQELFNIKYDYARVNNSLQQLNQIKQNSELLERLKINIEFYNSYRDELKAAVEKIIELDKKSLAANDEMVKELKLKDITNYIYNYYDFSIYPYYSEIITEIIKRKFPDPDSDISDLLNKI